MEKPYTKEQLLGGIRSIDKFLNSTEDVYRESEELVKGGIPDDLREEWEMCVIERRAANNCRILLANDLFIRYGIIV